MTGQELYEHVQELAADLDVEVWVCLTCTGRWSGVARMAFGEREVVLTGLPDEPGMYLVALHELGHHATSSEKQWRKGLTLDREAAAWRWAIEAMPAAPGKDEWTFILSALRTYTRDGRYRHTPAFSALLYDAVTGAT